MRRNIAFIGVGMLKGDSNQGIPAFVNAMNELSKRNDVTVYSFVRVDPKSTSVRVRYIPSQRIPQKIQFAILALLFSFDHLRKKYHIIHAQSPFPGGHLALFLHRLFSVPWILAFHAGEAAFMPKVPFGDLLNPYLKKINVDVTRKARYLQVMSSFQALGVKQNLGAIGRIRILPRGINPAEKIAPKKISMPLQLLHISNFHPVKGPIMLLTSFLRIREAMPSKLTIVGANYDQDFLKLLENFGLTDDVHVMGPIQNEQLESLFHKSHILLHTSFFEGLPMVALEAMANGVVVCGTKVGIMADLSDQYCVTVDVGDHDNLAAKVISLVDDPFGYETLRKNAYQWISEHNMNWYISEWEKYFEEVCESK